MMGENSQSSGMNGAHTKHGVPAHSRKSNGGGCRNSSIELLRIIAMSMILIHHFIAHNGYDALKLPLGPERSFFQLSMVAFIMFPSHTQTFSLKPIERKKDTS